MNKPYDENVLKHKDVQYLIKDITCDTCDISSKSCMYRACTECKGKSIVTRKEDSTLSFGKIVIWKVCKSKRVEREIKKFEQLNTILHTKR